MFSNDIAANMTCFPPRATNFAREVKIKKLKDYGYPIFGL